MQRALTTRLCVVGTLLIATTAQAGFQGLVAEQVTEDLFGNPIWSHPQYPGGLRIIEVYATFDDPTDTCSSVGEFMVHAGSPFVNSEDLTNDQAPLAAKVSAVPSLHWDSFFTIGLRTSGPGSVDGPGDLQDLVFTTLNGPEGEVWTGPGWSAISGTAQTVSGSYDYTGNFFLTDFRVLLMRLVIPDDAYSLSVECSVAGTANGQVYFVQDSLFLELPLPDPCITAPTSPPELREVPSGDLIQPVDQTRLILTNAMTDTCGGFNCMVQVDGEGASASEFDPFVDYVVSNASLTYDGIDSTACAASSQASAMCPGGVVASGVAFTSAYADYFTFIRSDSSSESRSDVAFVVTEPQVMQLSAELMETVDNPQLCQTQGDAWVSLIGPDKEIITEIAANGSFQQLLSLAPGTYELSVNAMSTSFCYGGGGPTFVKASYDVQFGPRTCSGDVNLDGVVDVGDLVAIVLAWATADINADLDGDGLVDVADLSEVVLSWGRCLS